MPLLSTFGAGSVRAFGGGTNVIGGGSEVVESLFSTYVYEGDQSDRTITNGINLSEKGGLVWIREREGGNHFVFDTERTLEYSIQTNERDPQSFRNETVEAYNTDGFDLGTGTNCNETGKNFVSWTFRKSPKFFDIVTYTGDSNSQQVLSHNLGSDPGMVIIKSTNTNGTSWWTWHRSFGANTSSTGKQVALDSIKSTRDTGTIYSGSAFDWSSPNGAYEQGSYLQGTSSTNITVGYEANQNTWEYVAYLFAHNDGDGNFGPNGDADIIKCGNVAYSGGATVNLGWEPQWVLVKPSDSQGNWILNDNMRGMPSTGRGPRLDADNGNAKLLNAGVVNPTATGFTVPSGIYNPTDLIYVAIRRGPMAVPTSATDVFAIFKQTSGNGNGHTVVSSTVPPFPIDFLVHKWTESAREWDVADRLRGSTKFLQTNSTAIEATEPGWLSGFDRMAGYKTGSNGGVFGGLTSVGYFWKRAPGFLDCVSYTGTGNVRTIDHNLGVVPEMIWTKGTDAGTNWTVYHSGMNGGVNPEQYHIKLQEPGPQFDEADRWNDTAPTDSVFTIGTSGNVNQSGINFIAYLFASIDGVSKLGFYTGTGNTQTIDCGFTNGARFVLVKNITSSGFADSQRNWMLFDTTRGIVAGTEPYLYLNTIAVESNGSDFIDPHSSGFQVTNAGGNDTNGSGGTYIFYAIA